MGMGSRGVVRRALVLAASTLLVLPSAHATADEAANGSGLGNLRTQFNVRDINQERLCFRAVGSVESYPQVGSASAYVVDYRVGGLNYSGPVELRLNPFESFQNAQGSYATADCQLNTLGAPSHIPGGRLTGEVPGRRISCTYTDGTWRRVEAVITMTLRGACRLSVDGIGSAQGRTVELHEGVGYFFQPHEERNGPDPGDFTSFPLPPDGLMWADSFAAPSPGDPVPPQPTSALPPDLPPVP